ncbi:MAG TPA: 50S ribosomal protein L25 [Blastocatellia bacterium]|nr:50S ribosomal protein L25 [Blastocatellia bacterium]
MSLDNNISLTAERRTEFGKNASRRLRAAGLVPVTVYGGGSEAVSATVAKREFAALIRHNGRNVIFTLNVGSKATPVKISDVQIDPIKGFLVHADLMEISMTEKSKFDVKIKIVGEADGVKNFGGFLDVPTHTLEIRCLPNDLPTVIEVDVTNLGLGDHLSVKDLKLGDKIDLMDDPNKVLATVVAAKAEEAAEGATEAAEPEVLKKGKTEEK